jgi:hypothetical protein
MLLLCCCLRDRQSRKDVRSADGGEEMVQHRKGQAAHHNQHIDVSKQELKELERPSEINMKLEVSINLWEQAIHEYDELESHLLDSGDAELKAVLATLRNQPVPYLNSKNEKVRSLAVKRNEVFVREKAIGTKSSKTIETVASPVARSASQPAIKPVNSGLIGNGITRTVSAQKHAAGSLSAAGADSDTDTTTRLSATSMQRRISKTWAAHIQEIDQNILQANGGLAIAPMPNGLPSMGRSSNRTIQQQNNNNSSSNNNKSLYQSKIRPKWPDYLLDVSFEVLKVNSIGKKLRRTMKLTEYHILNIKEEGNEVSKVHKYVELSQVWLETTNILKIKLKDGLVLTYISPIAPHIVQQISTRVKTRLALNKTVFSDPVVNFGELPASIEHLVAAISAENAINSTTSMQSFATELASKFAKQPARVRVSFGVDAASDEEPRLTDSNSSDKSGKLHVDRTSSSSTVAENKPKIHAFTEQMSEHRVQEFVRGILFDAKTDEGNTRNDFVKTFVDARKTLRDVRSFIDGMHNYILSSRGIQLATKLLNITSAIPPASPPSSSQSPVLESYSFPTDDVIPGARESVSDDDGGVSVAVSGTASQLPGPPVTSTTVISPLRSLQQEAGSSKQIHDLTDLDSSSIVSLSFIVFTVVEESVYVPLSLEIQALLPSGVNVSVM